MATGSLGSSRQTEQSLPCATFLNAAGSYVPDALPIWRGRELTLGRFGHKAVVSVQNWRRDFPARNINLAVIAQSWHAPSYLLRRLVHRGHPFFTANPREKKKWRLRGPWETRLIFFSKIFVVVRKRSYRDVTETFEIEGEWQSGFDV